MKSLQTFNAGGNEGGSLSTKDMIHSHRELLKNQLINEIEQLQKINREKLKLSNRSKGNIATRQLKSGICVSKGCPWPTQSQMKKSRNDQRNQEADQEDHFNFTEKVSISGLPLTQGDQNLLQSLQLQKELQELHTPNTTTMKR